MRHIKTMLGLGDGLVLVSPCHTHLWSGSSPHWGRRIELTPQHWPLTSIWLPWHMHVPTRNMDTHDKENSLVANYFRGIISLINVTDIFFLILSNQIHISISWSLLDADNCTRQPRMAGSPCGCGHTKTHIQKLSQTHPQVILSSN